MTVELPFGQSLVDTKSKQLFGFDSQINPPMFEQKNPFVPEVDEHYHFHPATTEAIFLGFKYNKRVLIQGLHGTGKSSHIQQVAARLNWGCMRINLDGHLNRLDLVGKDTLKIQDGKQITEYQYGIIPWALQRPIALILDEYDAGKPEIMFILQQLLETDGKFVLLDCNELITPHPHFRIFATSNTLGLGDHQNMYFGTNRLNQAQLDRWNIICQLNYLPMEVEQQIVMNKVSHFAQQSQHPLLKQMITLAQMTRNGMASQDLTTLMSPRTVINWAENYQILQDIVISFKLSFYNRVDEYEKPIVNEYFQRVFDLSLIEDFGNQ